MLDEWKHGGHFYERVWRPSELVVADMEARGVGLDVNMCALYAETANQQVDQLGEHLSVDLAGKQINWGSPKQVSEYLYDELAIPLPPVAGTSRAVQLRQEDKRPTSEAALEYIRDHHPQHKKLIETLLDWKTVGKLASFWETLPNHVASDGRIHPQMGPNTETGRLSCRNPNLQQQPPETRAAFVAKPGYALIALDYEGLEWRILAHVLAYKYGDTSLVEEIEAGIDPHSATAVAMGLCPGPVAQVKARFPAERANAKILNYSINYGKTAAGLGVQIRDSFGEGIGAKAGQALLDGFYEARPGIARFHRDIVKYAEGKGGVRSLLGRFRPIDQPYRVKTRFGEKEGPGARQAKNVIQNCAADVVTLAMLRCNTNPELKAAGWYHPGLADLGCDLLLQIHDELLFEVPEANAAEARELAAQAMASCLDGVRDFRCPLGVSGGYGPNWAAASGKA